MKTRLFFKWYPPKEAHLAFWWPRIQKKNGNESWHIYEWVIPHMWMSHVTHMSESCHIYEWVMSHIWMSHVTHMNESFHICEWVMSHIWVSHVTHMNEWWTRKKCDWHRPLFLKRDVSLKTGLFLKSHQTVCLFLVPVYMCLNIYLHAHTHIYVYIYMYIYICIYIYVYVYVYIHIYMYKSKCDGSCVNSV